MSKATNDFKIYLNSILNKVDDEIHEELWNHLTNVITEKILENEAYHQSELIHIKNPYNQKKEYLEWSAVENLLDIEIRKLKQ